MTVHQKVCLHRQVECERGGCVTDIFPAQHNTPSPLGIPWPSCSASPAASWVVQLDLGEGWLSGESHSGPKPRCGTALLCTGQLTDWEPWLSTSAPETVPSVQGPAGQGGTEHLACLTKTMQSEATGSAVFYLKCVIIVG